MPLVKTYEELEYITVDGNQYFDTDFKPNQETSAEMSYDLATGSKGGTLFFGSTSSWASASFGIYRNSSATKIFSNYNDDIDITSSLSVSSFNGKHIVKRDRNLVYLDGSLKYTHGQKSFQSTRNLLICNTNDQLENTNYAFIGKIYYVKVWDNGDLIRELVPAKSLKDNTIGLYDKVNEVFYLNQGTGTPTGSSKSVPTYIEERAGQVTHIDPQLSTNWINAGLNITSTTLLKYRFRIDNAAALTTSATVIFGSGKWSSNAFLLTIQNGTFGYYGSTPYALSIAPVLHHQYYFTLSKSGNNISITFTDETTGETITKTTTDTYSGQPIYIGHCTGSTSAVNYPNSVSTISCTITNGTIEREFVPVRYKGEYCLLDTVEGKLYHNQGTGTFTGGNAMTYELLESIESTGTQYIDTNYIPQFNTKVEFDYSFTTITTAYQYQPLFYSGEKYNSADTFGEVYLDRDKKIVNYCGNKSNINGTARTVNVRYLSTFTKDKEVTKTVETGVETTTTIGATSFTPGTRTLYLCAGNTTTADLYNTRAKLKIFGVKISENDDVKRDFIPAKRLEDGEVGLLDTTTNTFYGNSGTGKFKANSFPVPKYLGHLQTYSVNGLTKKLQNYQNTIRSVTVSSYSSSGTIGINILGYNCYRICRQLCYISYRCRTRSELQPNTNYAFSTRFYIDSSANNSRNQTLQCFLYNNNTNLVQMVLPVWIQSGDNYIRFRTPNIDSPIPSGTDFSICGTIRYEDPTY